MQRKFLKDILRVAKLNIEKDGKLLPVAFIDTGRGMAAVGIASFEDTDQKHKSMQYLGESAATGKIGEVVTSVREVALVAESWVSTAKKDEGIPSVMPSKDPNRKEAIVIMTMDKNANEECLAVFLTKEKDKIKFGKSICEKMPAPKRGEKDNNPIIYHGLLGYFWRGYLGIK